MKRTGMHCERACRREEPALALRAAAHGLIRSYCAGPRCATEVRGAAHEDQFDAAATRLRESAATQDSTGYMNLEVAA
jgi:hypothetical protein